MKIIGIVLALFVKAIRNLTNGGIKSRSANTQIERNVNFKGVYFFFKRVNVEINGLDCDLLKLSSFYARCKCDLNWIDQACDTLHCGSLNCSQHGTCTPGNSNHACQKN